MLNTLSNGVRWSGWLGAKFFWAVPGSTTTVVVATLVSQVSMLLAFFLPLKVIILLGSEGVPRYFPPSFGQLDRDTLILFLSLATIAFYALYLLADRLVQFAAGRGAQRLLQRSSKIVLFENQDDIAAQAYRRYSSALAGGVFVGLALLLVGWLYTGAAWTMVSYMVVAGAALVGGTILSPRLHERLEDELGGTMSVLAAVGFMLVFAYLVVDFLYRDPPGLIPAIIALLLSRQAFQRLSGIVPGLTGLYRERSRLDALFFHRRALVPDTRPRKKSVWRLVEPETRRDWVADAIAEISGEPPGADAEITWWQTGVIDVPMLHCLAADGNDFLIKLFGENRSGQAQHEATLLAEPIAGLPGPEWGGVMEVRGFQCHVFRLHGDRTPTGKESRAALATVRERLLRVRPDHTLTARYRRSRAFLWQRLDEALIAQLRVATDARTRDLPERLSGRLHAWREWLRSTPLAFTNPDLRPANLVMTADGEPYLLHWGRWTLEPAGTGWAATTSGIKTLKEALAMAQTERHDLAEAQPDQYVLAAMTAQLEVDCKGQQYTAALAQLHRIENCLDRLEGAPSS